MKNNTNSQGRTESSSDFGKIAESSLDSAPHKSARRSLSLSLSLRGIFNHP